MPQWRNCSLVRNHLEKPQFHAQGRTKQRSPHLAPVIFMLLMSSVAEVSSSTPGKRHHCWLRTKSQPVSFFVVAASSRSPSVRLRETVLSPHQPHRLIAAVGFKFNVKVHVHNVSVVALCSVCTIQAVPLNEGVQICPVKSPYMIWLEPPGLLASFTSADSPV
jgi:hypothetical protein